jgi:virginiamycin B lyase
MIRRWPPKARSGTPEQELNTLGCLDPVTGNVLKTPDSGPHSLVADRAGNIWFTANFKGYIGKLGPRTG